MFHFGKCFGNVMANVDTLVAQWLKLVPDKTGSGFGRNPCQSDSLCRVCAFSKSLRKFPLGTMVASHR